MGGWFASRASTSKKKTLTGLSSWEVARGDTIELLIDGSGSTGNGAAAFTYAQFRVLVLENNTCYNGQMVADLNLDCRVDMADFALLVENWLVDCVAEPDNPAYLNDQSSVALPTFGVLSSNWQFDCASDPQNPACQ